MAAIFLKSEDIDVFPSGYRGQGYIQSKLTTESNVTSYVGKLSSYKENNNLYFIDPYDSNYSILIISGYVFRFNTSKKPNKDIAYIKLGKITNPELGLDLGDRLLNLNDPSVEVLDATDSSTDYFYGLAFDDAVPGSGYLSINISNPPVLCRLSANEIRATNKDGIPTSDSINISDKFETDNLIVNNDLTIAGEINEVKLINNPNNTSPKKGFKITGGNNGSEELTILEDVSIKSSLKVSENSDIDINSPISVDENSDIDIKSELTIKNNADVEIGTNGSGASEKSYIKIDNRQLSFSSNLDLPGNSSTNNVVLGQSTAGTSIWIPYSVQAVGSTLVMRDTDGSIRGAIAGEADIAKKVSNAITFNNSGIGATSGTSFDGSSAKTISYNTIGAATAAHSHSAHINSGDNINGSTSYLGTTESTLTLGDSGVTAGTYGSSNTTTSHSGTFTIPRITVNKKGIVTNVTGSTITLPPSGNTDSKVTQIQMNDDYNRPLLTSVLSTSSSSSQTTDQVYYNKNIYANLYTGQLTAVSFYASSDKRLKENINDYTCNKSILDLPVKSFTFKTDKNKTKHIGCLAQDLQKICPEIVSENSEGYLSINESKIVYLLLEEVKKLRLEVEDLKSKL